MNKFDRIKTLQLVLFIAFTAVALVSIIRDPELYKLIATNGAAKTISIILWVTLGMSFLFLLYDFSSYADMRRENMELDNAVYSDALTGIANRYSVDAFIGQFLGKPLPEDMGVVTIEMTNLQDINKVQGHSGGDRAIQSFATILQDAAGRTCFIGRNGGNKFGAIFRDWTDAKLARFLAKVKLMTEERNTTHSDVPIRYTVGTAFNEGGGVGTVTELVALSDRRAWQAHQK